MSLTVQNFSSVITGLLIAMITNWRLALVVLVLIPLVGLQGYAQIKFLKGFSQDAKVSAFFLMSKSSLHLLMQYLEV